MAIDIALVQSDGGHSVRRGPCLFVPYTPEFSQRIEEGLRDAENITDQMGRPGNLSILENDITDLHAIVVKYFIEMHDIAASAIDIIGFHGQTILHCPKKSLTIQLGDGQKLAQATNIDVAYDLRINDIHNGGQGAPLVPVYHQALSHSPAFDSTRQGPLVFVNIGGISNITYIGKENELIAFDCGPGNMLIDQWVKRKIGVDFDKSGKTAEKGKINNPILDYYMSHPYFDLPVPKSLDRKDFAPLLDMDITLNDGARTLARTTACAIMRSIEYFPAIPRVWGICGGGVMNKTIMNDLYDLTKKVSARILTAEEVGLNSAAMEAEAFAYLAIRSKLGRVLTFPSTTGCKKPVPGGKIAFAREN